MITALRPCLALLSVAAMVFLAEAQPAANVPRVGVLLPAAPPPPVPFQLAALRKGLRDRGYEEGKTIVIESRYGANDAERLAAHARELVRNEATLLVTAGDLATRIAMQATTSIPIVASVGDPVLSGFVASLAQPGGNVTGVAALVYDLAAKRLEVMKEAVPRTRRVAVLWDAALHPRQLEAVQEAGRVLKLEIHVVSARKHADIEPALNALGSDRVDALYIPVSPLFPQARQRIIELVARKRLPTVYPDRLYVEAGGLVSYGTDALDVWSTSMSSVVDKILRGARPADVPIQQPTKVELVINRNTVNALGLTLPPALLHRVDQVIDR